MSLDVENDRLKNENLQLKLETQNKTIQRLTERCKTLQKALKQFRKESSTKEKKFRALLSTNAKEMDKKLQNIQTLNDANKSYQQNRVTMEHNIQTLQQQLVERDLVISQHTTVVARWKRVAAEREEVAKQRLGRITELEEHNHELEDTLARKRQSVETKGEASSALVGSMLEKKVDVPSETRFKEKEQLQAQLQAQLQTQAAPIPVVPPPPVAVPPRPVLEEHNVVLKQALFRYFTTKNVSERLQLATVISQVLKFEESEHNMILESVQTETAPGVLTGWFGA